MYHQFRVTPVTNICDTSLWRQPSNTGTRHNLLDRKMFQEPNSSFHCSFRQSQSKEIKFKKSSAGEVILWSSLTLIYTTARSLLHRLQVIQPLLTRWQFIQPLVDDSWQFCRREPAHYLKSANLGIPNVICHPGDTFPAPKNPLNTTVRDTAWTHFKPWPFSDNQVMNWILQQLISKKSQFFSKGRSCL